MATPIEVTGTLGKPVHKLDKTGEVVVFSITTKKTEAWHRLVAHAEGDVKVTLEPQQGELDMAAKRNGKGKRGEDLPRGVAKGSAASKPSHQAQD